jgi:DNA-binding MarR family transcriptional regulator
MAYEQLKLDNQVCFRLYSVTRLITQRYQPWLSKLGITYTQYIVMMVLWEQDHQPVNDIAKRLLLETNTVTPLIQRLEAEGLVRREKDKADARKTIVSLTPKGQELEEQAAEVPSCMTQMFVEEGLDAEVFNQMIPSLDEIICKIAKK